MRFSAAVVISVVVHGLIAAGVIACLEFAPGPEVCVELDLSSVELSFAEEDRDSAVAAPMPPSPPPETARPEPKPRADLPEPIVEKTPAPPDPDSVKLPKPEPEKVRFEPVPAPGPEQPADEPPPVAESAPAAETPAPRQAKIDAPPKPRRAIRPDYPRGARQRGEQGSVVLEIRVDADGRVAEVRVVDSTGFPELDAAAVKAVKSASFTPAKSDGEPVAASARISLTFRLRY